MGDASKERDRTNMGGKRRREGADELERDLAKPSSPTVYSVIAHDGEEEMGRPAWSLWWSGVAAGLAISISLYTMAALRVALGDMPGAYALEKFGYCVGFLLVVLGRLQLFTENTITPVPPALSSGTFRSFYWLGRIWVIVLVANLSGTFLAAALPTILPVMTAEQSAAILEISRHYAERDLMRAFASAIPAGFLIAAMVWMMPSSKGFEFFTIVTVTYVVAISDTAHVIVGSAEIFTLVLAGEMSSVDAALELAVTGLCNIIGGTGLFALLVYAQVSEEL